MLNRLKNIKINYAMLLACVYLVKTLVLSVSIADSLILIGLVSLVGYQKYLESKKPVITFGDKLKQDLDQLKNQTDKEIREINSVISKAKVATLVQNQGTKFKF